MVNKIDRPNTTPIVRGICTFALYFSVFLSAFLLLHSCLWKAFSLCSGSWTMAYTTRNTVNRLARTRTIKRERNQNIELQKHKLDQMAARNIRISPDKRIAFSKYRRLRRKMDKGKYDTHDKNLSTVQANSFNHSRAWQFRMQVSNTFTVNVIFCPSKANTWRLKNISCNRNEPKQYTNTLQIIEVSNSTKRHAAR